MSRSARTLILLISWLLAAIPAAGFNWSDVYYWIGPEAPEQARNTGLTIFPTLIIPPGGEYEGMGQAYTAVARDSSFFDANPAGSATLDRSELTFIHNDWIADTAMDGIIYTMRLDRDRAVRDTLEDWGIAVGGKFLHVPFTAYDALTRQTGSGQYSEGTVGVNASYNMLRSYEFPGVAVGATIKAAYRLVPEAVAANQSIVGVAADVGVLTRVNFLKTFTSSTPNFAAGITARNMGPPVGGEALPSQVTAGISYAPIRPLLVALDVIQPLNLAPGVLSERLGGAVGFSVNVTPFFSAQAGMLLKWGASRISMGATVDLADVSVDVNYNLDLATQLSGLNRFSIQARLDLGDQGRADNRARVDELYLQAWILYTSGQLAPALQIASESLAIDPRFLPARQLKVLIETAIDLDKKLEDIDQLLLDQTPVDAGLGSP